VDLQYGGGGRQTDFPHFYDITDTQDKEGYNSCGRNSSKINFKYKRKKVDSILWE